MAGRAFVLSFFIVIATLLWFIAEPKPTRPKVKRPLGQIESIEGRFEIKPNGLRQWFEAKPGEPLGHFDRVRALSSSMGVIHFPLGLSIEVGPEVEIVLEEQESASRHRVVIINVLRGQLKVREPGPRGAFLISHNRQVYDPAGRILDSNPSSSNQGNEVSKLESFMRPLVPSGKMEGLSDAEISRVVSLQVPMLTRCYDNFLRSGESKKGQMQLSFSILPQGVVEAVKVLSSDFSETNLDRCVQEVFSRSKFKKFEGKPIVVNYPVRFE